MDQGVRSEVDAIGYLSVITDPRHGFFGGYLIVNATGRPLEFHCTAPVRANRAQEILYGPTLQEFLYGEHIGRALVERADTTPDLFCTDAVAMLALRPLIKKPLALVFNDDEPSGHERRKSGADEAPDQALSHPPLERDLTTGSCRITCAATHAKDLAAIDRMLPNLEGLDFAEPFERIYAAIEEAHGPARPESEAA